jgi:tetratricopeptide (TPR) repeat protein
MERSQLGQKLAQGGEGEIFLTTDRSLVAKVYHEGKMTPEVEQKLRAMLANPPLDSMRVQGRVSIAWAVDLVTVNGIVKGYTMPLLEKAQDEHLSDPRANLSKCRDLIDFYNPSTRRKNFPWFHYGYLIRTARNIAIVTDSLHAKGYAIGDVNESNILVALDTIVTFVDTDSFQVPGHGKNFRCQVGKPEYTPPELQGVSFKEIDRTQAHDLFGLGVLIFQLLMQGQHPFAGKYLGQGETPEIKDRIKAGHFQHGNKQVPYVPIPLAPAFTILPLRLQELFIQCFETGHNAPDLRPTAEQWNQALEEADRELKQCSVNEHHFYSKHLGPCSWCEMSQRFGGRDPFPSQAEIQGGTQLQKPSVLQLPITSITPPTSTVIHPKASTIHQASVAPIKISQNISKPIVLSGNSILENLRTAVIITSAGALGYYLMSFLPISKNKTSTVADYSRAISIDPTNVAAYNNRGSIKYELGDKKGAISDYSQAILIDPVNVVSYHCRGSVKYNLGDKKGAIFDYNQAIIIDPTNAIPYYHRGCVKHELGDEQGAVSDFDRAISIDPNYSDAFNNRGFVKDKLGDNQGAIADFDRAISLVNNSDILYVNRGAIKYDSDKQGAIADFDRAISINPANAEAYNRRGVIKYELGDKDGAIADIERAISIDPNYVGALKNRASFMPK